MHTLYFSFYIHLLKIHCCQILRNYISINIYFTLLHNIYYIHYNKFQVHYSKTSDEFVARDARTPIRSIKTRTRTL